jgi:hypothetical protein
LSFDLDRVALNLECLIASHLLPKATLSKKTYENHLLQPAKKGHLLQYLLVWLALLLNIFWMTPWIWLGFGWRGSILCEIMLNPSLLIDKFLVTSSGGILQKISSTSLARPPWEKHNFTSWLL